MASEVLVAWGPGETRLALVREGRLHDFHVVRPDMLAGSVVLGRVCELAPKLSAAFVQIGQDQPGFLSSAKGLAMGQAVLVQVKADPQGGKGAVLTTDIALPGRHLIYTPRRPGVAVSRKLNEDKRARVLDRVTPLALDGEGIVVRPSASAASEMEFQSDLEQLRRLWSDLQSRRDQDKAPAVLWRPDPIARMLDDNPGVSRILVDDAVLFQAARAGFGDMVEWVRDGAVFAAHDLEDDVAGLLEPEIPLACGGRVIIEGTAALTAIDVDSGPASPLEANTQAVPVIARHLRLRNIAGQIVVDFVSGGGKGGIYKLVSALKQAISRDPIATHVVGVSPLGLVEMTRERKGVPLAELALERSLRPSAAAAAYAALRRVLEESRHRPGRALGVVVAPEVAHALSARPRAVAEAEERLGRKLVVRVESGRGRGDTDVEQVF